jgi:hypothetical protein
MITSLLHPTPHTKIMVVTSHLDSMAEELSHFLTPYEGVIDLSLFPGEHQNLAPFHKTFTIKDYKSPAGGFRVITRAVIVQDVLHLHESPQQIFRAESTVHFSTLPKSLLSKKTVLCRLLRWKSYSIRWSFGRSIR